MFAHGVQLFTQTDQTTELNRPEQRTTLPVLPKFSRMNNFFHILSQNKPNIFLVAIVLVVVAAAAAVVVTQISLGHLAEIPQTNSLFSLFQGNKCTNISNRYFRGGEREKACNIFLISSNLYI